MKNLPVADVKRDFRRVLDAAERGEATVVSRHGRPVAVIGPIIATGKVIALPRPRKPGGLLSLVGTLDQWPEIEDDMAGIVADRQNAIDRPPPDLD